jgi:hypothetical protein
VKAAARAAQICFSAAIARAAAVSSSMCLPARARSTNVDPVQDDVGV